MAYITRLPQDQFADAKEATCGYWSQKDTGWILFSPGPDRRYEINPEKDYDPSKQSPQPELILKTYDPTNGITSAGDLWRVKHWKPQNVWRSGAAATRGIRGRTLPYYYPSFSCFLSKKFMGLSS